MPGENSSPSLYTPRTINELLTSCTRNPDAVLFAGGTWLMESQTAARPNLPRKLIALKGVEDLNRITRNERNLELGACVSLNRILEIGSHIVPELLHRVILSTANSAVRNLATIGGNIGVPDYRMSLFPALLISDTRIEIRSSGHSRWQGLQRLIDHEGRLTLKPGEVITRFRIPLDHWPIQYFKLIHSGFFQDIPLLRCFGLADVQKEILADMRFVVYSRAMGIIRMREMEAGLIGRRIPLPERDIAQQTQLFSEALGESPTVITDFIRQRSTHVYRDFLRSLSPQDYSEAP